MTLIQKYNIDIKKYLPKKIHNYYEPFSFTLESFTNLDFKKAVTFVDKTQLNTTTLVKTLKYYHEPLKSLIKELSEYQNVLDVIKEDYDEEVFKETETFKKFQWGVLYSDWQKIIKMTLSFIKEHSQSNLKEKFKIIDSYFEKFDMTTFYRSSKLIFDVLEQDKEFLENIQDSYLLIQLEESTLAELTPTQVSFIEEYIKNLANSTINYLIITDYQIKDFQQNNKIQKQEFDPFLYIYHNLSKHTWFDFPSTILQPEFVIDKNIVETPQEVTEYSRPEDDANYDDGGGYNVDGTQVEDEVCEDTSHNNDEDDVQNNLEKYANEVVQSDNISRKQETQEESIPEQKDRFVQTPIEIPKIIEKEIIEHIPTIQIKIPNPPMLANIEETEAIKAAKRTFITKENAKHYKLAADAVFREVEPRIQEQIELGNHVKARDKWMFDSISADNPAVCMTAEDFLETDDII